MYIDFPHGEFNFFFQFFELENFENSFIFQIEQF